MDYSSVESKIINHQDFLKTERDLTVKLANLLYDKISQKMDDFLWNVQNSNSKDHVNMMEEFFKDLKNVQDSWSRNNHLFQKVLGNIQDIFSGHLKKINDKADEVKDNQKHEEIIWIERMKRFYPKPNAMQLTLHEWHSGVISSITDAENGYFFIVYDTSQVHEMLHDLNMLNEVYENIPDIGAVFGYKLDKNNVRAMRIPSPTESKDMRLFFLDSGELMDCEFEYNNCFKLPFYLSRAPSLAFFSLMQDLQSNEMPTRFIEKHLNQNVEFKIVRIESGAEEIYGFLDTFHIILRSKESDDNDNNIAINLNCPDSDYSKNDESYEDIVNKPMSVQKPSSYFNVWNNSAPNNDQFMDSIERLPDRNEIEINDFTKVKEVPQSSHDKKQKKVPKNITSQDIKLDNSADESLTNDTTKINSQKRKISVKSPGPDMLNSNYVKNYWTSADSDIRKNPNLKLPGNYRAPSEGSLIYAWITAIESVQTFYVRLMKIDCKVMKNERHTDQSLTLMDLLEDMNHPDIKKTFQPLNEIPVKNQIVICPFSDKNYYRARVLNVKNGIAKVFFVDYGNYYELDYKELRKYVDKFSYLPYQAVKMHFANIEPKNPSNERENKEVLKKITEMCSQKMLGIDIVHNDGPDKVYVHVYDKGFDIGEKLIAQNFVAPRKDIYWDQGKYAANPEKYYADKTGPGPYTENNISEFVNGRFKRDLKTDSDNRIRGPYNANAQSYFMELCVVVDHQVSSEFGHNLTKIHLFVSDVINIINTAYNKLNIFIALTNVVVWDEEDEIDITSNSNQTLANFKDYRNKVLFNKCPSDNSQLITGQEFDNDILGHAYIGSICSKSRSCGINSKERNDKDPKRLARIMTHEIGHNFGITHDKLNCKCKMEKCIMDEKSSTSVSFDWSDCSIREIQTFLKNYTVDCLKNRPNKLLQASFCGNGFVEDGEECDCGLPENCKSKCCDPLTCKLTVNSICATGLCCDQESCKLKKLGTLCRAEASECDLPEYCTGNSEYCPNDFLKINFTICKEGEGICSNGICDTKDASCKAYYGPNSDATDECIHINQIGEIQFGNCGYNETAKEITKCTREHRGCGYLYCKNKLQSKIMTSSRFEIEGREISENGCTFFLEDKNPVYVKNGMKCGEGKMCFDHRCEVIGKLQESEKIPTCSNNCNGNGICNNLGHCHCNDGFAPPDCYSPGVGGSIDSGPRAKSRWSLTLILIVITLTLSAFIIAIYSIHLLLKKHCKYVYVYAN